MRIVLLAGRIIVALIIGVLLLLIWKQTFFYLDSQFFLPAITAYYKKRCWQGVDPIRDQLVFNVCIATAVGLVITFLAGLMLRLRWYVLALILIGIPWLLARALVDRHDLGIAWMLSGTAPYFFAGATCVGAWLGERVIRARKSLPRPPP